MRANLTLRRGGITTRRSVDLRALPNLLIVGVKKAGTSSLFDYLAQHPDVCPASVKEPGYFSPLVRDDGTLRSVGHYASYFDSCDGRPYRMEATPDYFYGGRRVIDAIARLLPQPRVVVTLRDPVTRLWSHYQMKVREDSRAVGGLSFDEYVRRCELAEASGRDVRGYAALVHGRYADFIGEWFETFGGDLRVVFLETWSRRPDALLRDLSRWLGIDENVCDSFDYAVTNRSADYRSQRVAGVARRLYRPAVRTLHRHPRLTGLATAMSRLRGLHDVLNTQTAAERLDPGMRRYLEEVYLPANRRLAMALVQRGYADLPAWLRPRQQEDPPATDGDRPTGGDPRKETAR